MSDKINEKKIRAHIRATIKEIYSENSATDKPTESKQLSEVRTHIRGVINEIMVGLTPITRIDNAKTAKKGKSTNSAVDKADIGFNTFDMQEWASIAGIDKKYLSESITDDTGDDTMLDGDDEQLDNVVDIGNPRTDSVREIPGMRVSVDDGSEPEDNRYDSAPYEAEGVISDMLSDIERRHLQFKANETGPDVDAMEAEVEGLADDYLANVEAGVINLSDYEDDYEDDDYNDDRFRLSDSDDDKDLSTVFDFSEF